MIGSYLVLFAFTSKAHGFPWPAEFHAVPENSDKYRTGGITPLYTATTVDDVAL